MILCIHMMAANLRTTLDLMLILVAALFMQHAIFCKYSLAIATATYLNILELGAVASVYRTDATTDFSFNSNSLMEAWSSACASAVPSTIHVPEGRFLLKTALHFKGPCANNAITLQIDGTLVSAIPQNNNNKKKKQNNYWLLFEGADGVSIQGGGTLDGQGAAIWACKKSSRSSICPKGATTLGIWNSRNVRIKGLKCVNSELFHIVINGCEDVEVEGVQVIAPGESPNTDGIHVQLSRRVAILNSRIGTGDDCVSIGPGTAGLWIRDVDCGPGHGISIGSLGKDYEEEGVQNVTLENATFRNAQNGLRIKTWGRPSKGFVRDVLFQHVIMTNVQNPILIDQNYCPDHNPQSCPAGQVSGVKISGVTYRDIQGTSATQVAMKFECSEANPCEGIRLENVSLSYENQEAAAQASCAHAAGTTSGQIQPSSCLY